MLETRKAEPLVVSYRQRLFLRYLMALFVDLIVLNLFEEFWDKITIDSFAISLMATIVMQILLRFTMFIEHKAAGIITTKVHKGTKIVRGFVAWAILFGSKFVILWIIDLKFGDRVEFQGVIPFILMLFSMIILEQLAVRLVTIKWFKGESRDKID